MSNTITKDRKGFAQIPNDLLNNPSISLTAKGLYAFMESKPGNWNFTIRSMAKQLKEGVAAISGALNELKEAGWISYTKHSDGKGSYHLFWSQQKDADSQDHENPNHENPNLENPNLENPDQGFPMLGKPVRISNKEPIVRKIAKEHIVELKPDIAEKVIQYLNKKTGKSFRPVKTHTDKINARIKEGATLTDLVRVIDRKCAEWLGDNNMSQYLRPATLFSAEKFNNYLGQVDAPMPAKRSSSGAGSSEIDFESRGWMS